MRTPATGPIQRSVCWVVGAVIALAACAPDSESGQSASEPETAAAAGAAEDCLLLVWSSQDDPDIAFDRDHDTVTGGAISCATGSSASRFRDALAAIRTAAASGDRAALLEETGIPLLYIDAAGNRRDLAAQADIDAVFDEIFDEKTIALLARLDVAAMSVAKDQGGFFELGSIWLAVPEPGARPKIVTVNKQALAEAAAAARDKALEDGDRSSDR